jgi:outer membrane autotransporter protein
VDLDESGSFEQDDSGTAFFIGAGGAFNFTENMGVRLEYEWWDVTPEYDDQSGDFVQEIDAETSFFSASFVYKF